MAVISRPDLKKFVSDGRLKIDPYDDKQLEPASYDCLLGDAIAAGVGRVDFSKDNEFILSSNSWASISSKEVFKLPNDVCASYGIRSGLARRGVISFGGPQIDPGYEGRIFLSIYNPTLEPIVLKRDHAIISMTFHMLTSADSSGYSGDYQGQKTFPPQDVELMMRMRSKNLADVIDNVELLDGSVRNLAENLNRLTSDVHAIKSIVDDARPWVKVIAWLLGAAAVAAIGWFVVFLLQSLVQQ
jgi:dCTP deaminase